MKRHSISNFLRLLTSTANLEVIHAQGHIGSKKNSISAILKSYLGIQIESYKRAEAVNLSLYIADKTLLYCWKEVSGAR